MFNRNQRYTVLLATTLVASLFALYFSFQAYQKYKNIESHLIWRNMSSLLFKADRDAKNLRDQYQFLREDYDGYANEMEKKKIQEKIENLSREINKLETIPVTTWTLDERPDKSVMNDNALYLHITDRIDDHERIYYYLKERFLRKYGTPRISSSNQAGDDNSE